MSAWIVDKTNIDLLVEAFFRYEIVTVKPQTPDSLGALLWKENYRSVNYRYNRRRRAPRYTFEDTRMVTAAFITTTLGTVKELARQPHFLWKQLGCYEYQSSEHPDWERSTAHSYYQCLRAAILKSAGLTEDAMYAAPEWDVSPWHIEYAD